MKQMDIKNLISTGVAIDITHATLEDLYKKQLKTLAISKGPYGANGAILKDENGKIYAITARCTNLFAVV